MILWKKVFAIIIKFNNCYCAIDIELDIKILNWSWYHELLRKISVRKWIAAYIGNAKFLTMFNSSPRSDTNAYDWIGLVICCTEILNPFANVLGHTLIHSSGDNPRTLDYKIHYKLDYKIQTSIVRKICLLQTYSEYISNHIWSAGPVFLGKLKVIVEWIKLSPYKIAETWSKTLSKIWECA